MGVERRLRQDLQGLETAVRTDVLDAYDHVVTGARRRRTRARLGAGAAIAAAALAAAIGYADLTRAHPEPAPVAPSPGAQLAGRYTVEVDGGGQADMSGQWVVEFRADGTLSVTPPATSSSGPASGAFTATADELRTNLFVTGECEQTQSRDPIATYAWSRSGARLTLTPITDGCRFRRTVLSSHALRSAP